MSLEEKEKFNVEVADFTAKIFGVNIGFKIHDGMLREILEKEISLYPGIDGEAWDILLETCSQTEFKNKGEREDNTAAIQVNSETARKKFIFNGDKLYHIIFSLHSPVNRVHEWVQKIRNMEFSNRKDRVGQIIHEQVLVPAMLFDEDKVPVHSSAVQFKKQVIMFGGHGGVGKTSLELELCFHNDADFIADDIGMLSQAGEVYPNLSYPKIYGYNVEGEPELKQRLIDRDSILDKLHWNLHFLKGANKVRRRISPADIYGNYVNKPVKVSRYLILERFEGKEIQVQALSPEQATEISITILREEFSKFFSELDKNAGAAKSFYSSTVIMERWAAILPEIFEQVECQKVLIPQAMKHHDFKKSMLKLFS